MGLTQSDFGQAAGSPNGPDYHLDPAEKRVRCARSDSPSAALIFTHLLASISRFAADPFLIHAIDAAFVPGLMPEFSAPSVL